MNKLYYIRGIKGHPELIANALRSVYPECNLGSIGSMEQSDLLYYVNSSGNIVYAYDDTEIALLKTYGEELKVDIPIDRKFKEVIMYTPYGKVQGSEIMGQYLFHSIDELYSEYPDAEGYVEVRVNILIK